MVVVVVSVIIALGLAKYIVTFRGLPNWRSVERRPVAFTMRISDDEMEDSESEAEEDHGPSSVVVTRFNCDNIYVRYWTKCTYTFVCYLFFFFGNLSSFLCVFFPLSFQ